MPEIDPKLLDLLRQVDTPTVCNAIEVAQGRRGFDDFSRGTVHAADANLPAVCGFALTARIRGSSPPVDPAEIVRKRRMAYYRYMAEGARPGIVVIEDLDGPDSVGAFWGEVNTTVHAGFGLAGVLTNGLVRDLGDLAPGFQVIAGGIGPSHHHVHVVDFDGQVTMFGLDVRPGHFVHADRHGAVVVPASVLPNLAEAITKMQASEALVLEPARAKGFGFAEFEAAWTAFEKARV